jgi:chromosome segregation ATPase
MNMVNGYTLTKEMIWQAAEKLLAEGKQPKVASVRDVLGKGSFSTINDAMKEWRAAQVKPEAPIREIAPSAISERLESFGGEIWAIAQEIATNRLKAEREALETARAEMEAQQTETAEMADHLAAEIEQLRAQLADQKNEITELEKLVDLGKTANEQTMNKLFKSEAENSERLTRISDLTDQIKHSRTLIVEAHQERDTLLNKTQEEREIMLQKERELIIENTKLLSKVDALTEKINLADHHLTEAKESIKSLKNENSRKAKEIQEALIEAANLKGQVNQLQKQLPKGSKNPGADPKEKN